MDKPSRLDQTIADIAAGETCDHTLAHFEQLASSDPTAWRRLALTLRDELDLRSQLDRQLNRDRHMADAELAHARHYVRRAHSRLWAAWAGWSMAAALLLALLLVFTVQSSRHESRPSNGVSLASLTAQEALDRYVMRGTEEGRLIAELPTVMVEARELSEGVLEVLYLRQFLEREQVNEVFTVASDELGMPHPVKVDFSGWDMAESSL